MAKRLGSCRLRLLAALVGVLVGTRLLMLVLGYAVALPPRLQAQSSTVLRYQDGRLMHVFLSSDEKIRIARPIEKIDPQYLRALVRLEDKRFYWHSGADPLAILRSAWLNIRAGHVVSGASTLTMQVARLAEPKRRTFKAKLWELLRALQLEQRFSKQEILEQYLRLVPYGRNIEGIESASYAYFGHGAEVLSADEIALLLAVPQDPTGRYPSPQNHDRLRAARDEIVEKLVAAKVLPDGPEKQRSLQDRRAQILAIEVPLALRSFPREAPHASAWLRARLGGGLERRTTLDRGAQALARQAMAAARRRLAPLGVRNGALVVVETKTAQLRALVGGFSFSAEDPGGQLAAFDEPRSPGSALKPVIYAMALDRGLALPEHLVADVPVDFRGYAPHNYDGRFTGLVRLEDALSRSLNIPFVNLLRQVGVETFIDTLRQLGARHLVDDPGYYGLSAAIGAVELTPLEMAGVFSTLGRAGVSRPLQYFSDPKSTGDTPSDDEALPVFSPGASYLTARALRRRDRPDFPGRRRVAIARGVFWKTGTSYGHRDAWAIGVGQRYTVAVWLGNLDNTPSISLVGAGAAGPILFDVLEALEPNGKVQAAAAPPTDLSKVMVCAYSGHVPGPACAHTRQVLALTAHVPTTPCPYHVAMDVDEKSGLRLRPGCRDGHAYKTQTFLQWPASVRRFLARQSRSLPEPPRLSPDCGEAERLVPPKILSPPEGMVALLRQDLAFEQQEIPLEADCPSGAEGLAWFVDGAFLGQVKARERLFWQPTPGRHELLVEDDHGQSATRVLEVRLLKGSAARVSIP